MSTGLKLTHKLGGAFAVLLCCALGLGGMALYSLYTLSANMKDRSAFDTVLELGQKAQFAAYDWLVHRESLAMGDDDSGAEQSPLTHYEELRAGLFKGLEDLRSNSTETVANESLDAYKSAFEDFDKSFAAYQHSFEEGVERVKGLRSSSVGILAKAQSLDKAINRKSRKLKKTLNTLREQLQIGDIGYSAADNDAVQKMIDATRQMELLANQKEISAIFLNKPLGFQEMAKDFILYKDEASGRGLIVEMEKYLGIDKAATMGESLPQLAAIFQEGREKKLLAQITKLSNDYLNAFRNYFSLNQEMKLSMHEMDEAQVSLHERVAAIQQEATAGFMAKQDEASWRMGALSLAAVLISCVFILLSITQVVLPLRRIIGDIGNACASITYGSNRTLHRIRSKGGDELGQLAGCFNELLDVFEDNSKEIASATVRAESEARAAKNALDSLQEAQHTAETARKEGMLDAVRALERIVGTLVQTSNDISSQVSAASGQAGELQRRTSESSNFLGEMGVSIQAVASSSSLAALNADEVLNTAHKGSDIVQDAINAIFEVRSQTDMLKKSLEQLNTHADSINQIMTVINDIADQTNLLALNAAIEAARAGDAGRGFAVVADEVRKLAEKTMSATNDVEQTIKSIQSSAKENVQGMIQAEEAVSGSTELAQEAGSSLRDIVKLIEESAFQVRNIATAVEQQSISSEQITGATALVNDIAGDMAVVMEKSDGATSDLMNLADELRNLIEGFKQECSGSNGTGGAAGPLDNESQSLGICA